MRNQSTIKFDISQIVSDSKWITDEGPDLPLLAALHTEIYKLTDYLLTM